MGSTFLSTRAICQEVPPYPHRCLANTIIILINFFNVILEIKKKKTNISYKKNKNNNLS